MSMISSTRMMHWLFTTALLLPGLFIKINALTDNLTVVNNTNPIMMSTDYNYSFTCQVVSTNFSNIAVVSAYFGGLQFKFNSTTDCTNVRNDTMDCSALIQTDFINQISPKEESVFCLTVKRILTVPFIEPSRSDSIPYKILYSPANFTLQPLIGKVGDSINITCSTSDTNLINPSMTFSIINSSYSQVLSCINTSSSSFASTYTCTGVISLNKTFHLKNAQCILSTNTYYNMSSASNSVDVIALYAPTTVTLNPLSATVGDTVNIACSTSDTNFINPIMTFTVSTLSYSVLTCTSSTNYTCTGTINNIEKTFDGTNAQCIFSTSTYINLSTASNAALITVYSPSTTAQSSTQLSTTTVAPLTSSLSESTRTTIILVVVLPTVGIAAIAVIVFIVKFISHSQTMTALEATYQPQLNDVMEQPSAPLRPSSGYYNYSMEF